jgi:hypothetical protein
MPEKDWSNDQVEEIYRIHPYRAGRIQRIMRRGWFFRSPSLFF